MRLFGARLSTLSVAALAAAGVLFACSTFSGDDPPAGNGDSGGGDGDGTSAADAAAETALPDAGVADAPVGMPVEAGRDAQFALHCGMTICPDAGDGCCRDQNTTPPGGYLCAPAMDVCPQGQLRYTCDDADDCTVLGMPGTVCCGTLAINGNTYFLNTTACALPENCVGPNEVRLCDRAVPGECPMGKTCDSLTTFTTMLSGVGAVSPPFPACLP